MKCRLCGGNDLSLYYTQGSEDQFRFYKCSKCELVNLDLTGLNLIEHQEKYATEYLDPDDPFINRGSLASYQFICCHLPQPGRFLDVGCGNGALLAAAQREGWDVRGLELSEFLAKNVRERFGIKVEVSDFLTWRPTDSGFDLVSLRHVLEHLPDSLGAMGSINQLLRRGGHALLEFPNIEGISFNVKRSLAKVGLHKKTYADSWRPGHCNEFSRNSFRYLAEQKGFSVKVWETYAYSPIKNFLYNHIPIGTKARVLVEKIKESP